MRHASAGLPHPAAAGHGAGGPRFDRSGEGTPILPDPMRVVVALGGNALLRRDEEPSARTQRVNIYRAAAALGDLGGEHDLVVTHGNGPQVGLLALQGEMDEDTPPFPLDVLGAETEGMLGYMISQQLKNTLPDRQVASLLTQVEVDPDDPAFARPTKPIGPSYTEEEARRLYRERGWRVDRDGRTWRRVVASPEPRRILDVQAISILLEHGVLVVCAGGGGIPVVFDRWGRLHGIEAVIDKDRTAALLAAELEADALLLLTDVDGIYRHWGEPEQERIDRLKPEEARALDLPEGSMRPKAEACARFVEATGGLAAIGALEDAVALLEGRAGTRVARGG